MAGWTCAGCTTTYSVGAAKCPNCGSTERTERAGGAVLPSVTVACGTGGCRYEGRERRVHLRTAAPGVVELPRLACIGCGFEMPTVTAWPPVTDSEDSSVPKNTVHGGASNAHAEPEAVDETAVEGGEEPSPGSSSSTSSVKEPSSPETSEPASLKRARTTGSRSRKGRTGSSSAAGTDGGQETGTSETDGSDA